LVEILDRGLESVDALPVLRVGQGEVSRKIFLDQAINRSFRSAFRSPGQHVLVLLALVPVRFGGVAAQTLSLVELFPAHWAPEDTAFCHHGYIFGYWARGSNILICYHFPVL